MKQVLAGVGLVAALVGGVTFATTREPAKAEAPMVVVPAGQPVSTGTPTVAASPSAVPVVAPASAKTTTKATTAPKPVAPKPVVKAAAPAPERQAVPVSSKQTVVKKATTTTTTTTTRSLAVASEPAPADPAPATPKVIAPDDPIRNTPPPPIPGNYTGGPVQPKEVIPPPPAE